ncbi:MAG: SDR family oxidoreductase [Candidatus Lambdaproteobacteria bacterium]|nr:SDR family oxidoreductase [Candidatus Lambdaproteobacteria bacterium]
MDLGIKGKVALVTAATKGLGRASAEELSREGCRVAICARTAADVERVAGEIAAETGNAVLPFTADMSREADIQALLAHVRRHLGDPEICVVNAGGPPPGTFETTPLDAYPAGIELTLMSGVRLTYGVVPAMKARGWGRIVFISSLAVKQPIATILLSNMARAGLTGFMKTLATELAPTGITLNAVLPGVHETDRIRQNVAYRAEQVGMPVEEVLRRTAAAVPMKRMGQPHELAGMVAFLASQRASFITGVSVQIDGGAYAGLL